MDANGTKFHLVYNAQDWEDWILEPRGLPLNAFSEQQFDEPPEVEYVAREGALRLGTTIVSFERSKNDARPDALLTGAARDRYETWYWLSDDGQEIVRQPADSSSTQTFWRLTADPKPDAATGDFRPAEPESAARQGRLRGLTITDDGYLVAGFLANPASPWPNAVLALDLNAGTIRWLEAGQPFDPASICAADSEGVWIADNVQQCLWRVYIAPRTLATGPAASDAGFSPQIPDTGSAQTYRVTTFDQILFDSVAVVDSQLVTVQMIARGGPGQVLILTGDGEAAIVMAATPDENGGYPAQQLELRIPTEDPDTGSTIDEQITAWALTYVEYTAECNQPWLNVSPRPGERIPLLVVSDRQRSQAVAYELRSSEWGVMSLRPLADYLPMRQWQGRAFVTSGCRVYYDFGQMWLPLQVLGEPRYAQRGTVTTPADFPADLALQPYDGEQYGCVWHRLVIDAQIPVGTRVSVRARAADAPSLLEDMPWLDQPSLYLRSNGAELPYYSLPVFRAPDPALTPPGESLDPACMSGPAHHALLQDRRAGSWELLFQNVRGRFVQLELTLEGTGRSTPLLYAMRIWYPRFSYLDHYLPAVFRQDPFHASFLERWLANFEGLFTFLEDQIDRLPNLLDPRIAPAEALDWLAGWMGLLLDPQWSEFRRRFFIRHAMDFYRLRGTPLGLEVALRLYIDPESTITAQMFSRETIQPWQLRLREDYLNARGSTDPMYSGLTPQQRQMKAAHRFRVRVPCGLTASEELMIRRIVNLEKPAHTTYELERRADGLVVGSAVLEVDSLLCRSMPTASPAGLDSEALDVMWLPLPASQPGQITLDSDLLCDDPSSAG